MAGPSFFLTFRTFSTSARYVDESTNTTQDVLADPGRRQQLAYATAPLFTLNQVATKGSILFMYYRIFGVNRVFAYWIFFTGALVVAWFIATVPLYLFACKPISRGWNPLVAGECLDNPPTVLGAEV